METVDIAFRILTLVGLPGIVIYYLRDRKRISNMDNKQKQVIPLEVRGVAATTFDAEMTAIRKSFDMDRALKDDTIRNLKEEVVGLRYDIELKDARLEDQAEQISSLRERVSRLQEQLSEVQQDLMRMSDDLTEIKEHPHGKV